MRRMQDTLDGITVKFDDGAEHRLVWVVRWAGREVARFECEDMAVLFKLGLAGHLLTKERK